MAKQNPAKKTRTINQQLTLLQRTVQAGIRRTDARFNGIESRLRGTDARFNGIESRLRGIDTRFSGIDARFRGIDTRLRRMDVKFSLEFRNVRKEMNERFSSVEDRIDRLATLSMGS